jgi:hypothetical protein
VLTVHVIKGVSARKNRYQRRQRRGLIATASVGRHQTFARFGY